MGRILRVRFLRRAVVAAMTVLVGAMAAPVAAGAAGGAAAGSQAIVRLSSMQPAPLGRSGARLEGAAAAQQLVRLRVYFASPAPSELRAAAGAIADPSSPDYRHYLNVGGFRALYAPPSTTIAAVNTYLRGQGLPPGPLDPNGMSEPVSGRVDQLNRALHTTMQQVETVTGEQEVGVTQAPELPANLVPAISYIDGLAPWATAYKLSGFYARGDTGSGTTIGLIEYDSYDQPAVATWDECLGTSPAIYVAADSLAPPPSTPQSIEATVDIETVMGVAPATLLPASPSSYRQPTGARPD